MTVNVPVSQAAQARAKWQEAMNSEILIVRCRDEVGEMHKNKLGSGGRGKCIKVGGLYTKGRPEGRGKLAPGPNRQGARP